MNINIEQLCSECEYFDLNKLFIEIKEWQKECSPVVYNILDSVLDIIIDNIYAR